MDYSNFLNDYESYNEYNRIQKKNKKEEDQMWGAAEPVDFDACSFVKGLSGNDIIHFEQDDRVNSPSHYTSGKTEVIDIIEDAVKDAPKVRWGLLQGQVLKYILRLWLKDNPLEDAKKAMWYLNRLIDKLEAEPNNV